MKAVDFVVRCLGWMGGQAARTVQIRRQGHELEYRVRSR